MIVLVLVLVIVLVLVLVVMVMVVVVVTLITMRMLLLVPSSYHLFELLPRAICSAARLMFVRALEVGVLERISRTDSIQGVPLQ
jgi:hypothetical protein